MRHRVFAERVGALVQAQIVRLALADDACKSYLPNVLLNVYAGIVATRRGDARGDATVLCVATGTKCISGEYLSDAGEALNDCHAEVVARRCLRSYLYDEVLRCVDPAAAAEQGEGGEAGAERSMEEGNGEEEEGLAPKIRKLDATLETGEGASARAAKQQQRGTCFSLLRRTEDGRFALREDVRLHLYISSAPCGDARIFSLHTPEDEADRHPHRKARGQLRSKIEGGEGTVLLRRDGDGASAPITQTWDGILRGERLLTMSCSDKVARWNLLGVQGQWT